MWKDRLRNNLEKTAAYKKDTVVCKLADKNINVKMAMDPKTMEIGMAAYDYLPDGCGMFFKTAGSFWMKDVDYPLDIAFLTKEGTVVDIQYMDKDAGFPRKTYQSKKANSYALELPGLYCLKNNINVGDKLEVL